MQMQLSIGLNRTLYKSFSGAFFQLNDCNLLEHYLILLLSSSLQHSVGLQSENFSNKQIVMDTYCTYSNVQYSTYSHVPNINALKSA